MKKLFVIAAVICLLTVPAFAVDWLDYSYINEDGVRVVDVDVYNAAVAEEKVSAAGLDLDVDSFWFFDDSGNLVFDNEAFELAYAAALLEQEEVEANVDDPIEDSSVDPASGDDSPDPSGSDSDESGVVLSPGDDLDTSGISSDVDLDSGTTDLDSGTDDEGVSVVVEDEAITDVYAVSDLRTGDTSTWSLVSGLKALIISIFGEYTPVLTTMAITETVDGVTTTTLIDAVAAGAAGVDYEWLAGVFLFGILLYCLMKLLGGILK